MSDLILRGKLIATDDQGRLSLTDMWRLAGEEYSKRPFSWVRLPTTKAMHEALKARLSRNKNQAETPPDSKDGATQLVATRRGRRGGGTFAHIILALAYAEYLNPELGVEVREIALRVYAGDVTVLDEYRRDHAEQLEEDGQRVMVRGEVRRNNSDLNAILKDVGATHAAQWAAFRHEKILDHMGFHELITNVFRTSMAQRYL